MKKVKAFTIIEFLVVLAIIFILIAMLLPALFAAKHRQDLQEAGMTLKVGDSVYIESLGVTGVVNRAVAYVNWSSVEVIVKTTNGTVSMIKDIDARLLKKVPLSPENEWKH